MDHRKALSLLGCLLPLLCLLDAAREQDTQGEQDTQEKEEKPIHERIDLPSIAACGGCHQEVYREWSESLHAKAWTNANVLNATKNFTKKSCRSCHSPKSVFETGFDKRPAYRDFNQLDGVHCLSCHGLKDGVAAARTIPEAPCKPKFEPRLLSADHCYPCHQPTHQAFDEYRTSDAFALGIRCVDCHMQIRPGKGGRSHGPHGGMNEAFVKRAISWNCTVQGNKLKVELQNRTGHKFPGEIPSRSFLVEVSFEGPADAAGERTLVGEPETLLLRKPHKGEDREDNRLTPDEKRILTFPFPDGAERASVSLLFKPLPLLPRESAFVLGSGAAGAAVDSPFRAVQESGMRVFAGTSGFSYKAWKGPFYPEDLPDKKMLSYYAGELKTVEINNTFYRMPKASVVEGWAEQVPETFVFVIKASQRITHKARLKDADELVGYLWETVSKLGVRLGPILFQLPPFFRKEADRLREFLGALPEECRPVLEFRHASWMDDEVFAILREGGAALCAGDTDKGEGPPLEATTDWGYLRMRRSTYTDEELEDWAARVRAMPWKETFVFFKHEDEGNAPAMAARFARMIEEGS